MNVSITLEQAQALAAWANDNHPGGTTAWGPNFSSAMEVAQAVRDKLSDPVFQALQNAPLDDEPFTAEEREEIAKGREELRRGEFYTTEELQTLQTSLTRAELETELNDMYNRGGVATCESIEQLLIKDGNVRGVAIVARFKKELLEQ